MGQVRDLTADAIGKVYRIQNNDGAYIEGTLDAVTFGLVEGGATDVIVSFKELKTSYKEGTKRDYIRIYTKPQHEATEVVAEELPDFGGPNSVVATRGPGIDGKLYPNSKGPASWRVE